MKLLAAEVEEFNLRLRSPLHTSRRSLTHRCGFILRVRAESGVTGTGEASPAYWLGGETIDQTRDSLGKICRLIPTQSAAELRAIIGDRSLCLTPAAAFALDTAILDAQARAQGIALTQLLGGAPSAIVEVTTLISDPSPEACASQARAAVKAGYRYIKLKVGAVSRDADLRRIEMVLASAAGAVLRLDANRGWSLEMAVQLLGGISAEIVEFVEEPLALPTVEELARLRSSIAVPIALDESIGGESDLLAYIQGGAIDLVVLKAARIGGLLACCRLAQTASRNGVGVVVTDSIESAVGMSAAVHLSAALGTPHRAIGLGGAGLLDPHDCDLPRSPRLQPGGPGLLVAALDQAQREDQ